jgi:hypothetical protein
MEKKSETGLRKDGVGGSRKNVISRGVSAEDARRSDIKNSLTEKWENCTTRHSPKYHVITVHDGDQT